MYSLLIIVTFLFLGIESHYDHPHPHPVKSPITTGTIIIVDQQVVIDKEINDFCKDRCWGGCEKCCGNEYDKLCNNLPYDENDLAKTLKLHKVCYDLFGYLDFICTESTYKIDVWGTATTYVPKTVFTTTTTPTAPVPTPNQEPSKEYYGNDYGYDNYDYDYMNNGNDYDYINNYGHGHGQGYGYGYGHVHGHGYGYGVYPANYYYEKRALSQATRNQITTASGTTQATCISGPQCAAVNGKKRGLTEEQQHKHHKDPDYVIYVAANPATATEYVPDTSSSDSDTN